jgi:hypothetical protein
MIEMTVVKKAAVVILALLVAVIIVARFYYAGTAPVKLPAAQCDASLWTHVYDKERLQVLEPCTAVDGRVVSIHHNQDGDVHVALDPDDKHVLNLINATHTHRQLVVEIICEGEQPACGSYRSTVTVPKAGDRIRVTGAYVTDRDNGWNEVHPVTGIDVLR